MARDVGKVTQEQDRLVNADWLGGRREFKFKLLNTCFDIHRTVLEIGACN
jgi:hypothetical protein